MDRQARPKMNTQIYEEACAWFVECRAGDLDDAGRREFDCWLRKSPEHLSSYLEIAAIWHEGPSLDSDSKWSLDTLIQHALDAGEDNVVQLTTTGAVAAPRRAWFTGWRRFAIAASIAALTILAGTLGLLDLSAPVYATALGEQRSIQFDDGSTIELNSRSKIRVRYSKQERDVELLQGQALFHVAHDTSRPFIVAVGGTRVRAVGTQFDVYKKSNSTVVTVVEGRVAVYPVPQGRDSGKSGTMPTLPVPDQAPTPSMGSASPRKHSVGPPSPVSSASGSSESNPQRQEGTPDPQTPRLAESSSFLVAAGEQLTVTADAAQKTANPNITGATAWRDREIVFESATLSDVAEEFNRYNQRQLVVDDPKFYGFHISGVFSWTDLDSLVRFLRERPGIKITETRGEIRVERVPPACQVNARGCEQSKT